MRRGRILFRTVSAGIALCCLPAVAQQPAIRSTGDRAQGRVMVTATVVSSVGLVRGPNGEQWMVIANAGDPKDNVSRMQPVVTVQLKLVTNEKSTIKSPKKKR
ncbi:MAG: hypothetical protein ACXV8X_14395 [Candidatus Angelobacter sp.]